MCGICGELRHDNQPASLETIRKMVPCLERRGPEAQGAWHQGPAAFGHRRLQIIDLSARGQQPMTDPETGMTIVFNGCIYNYPELRVELQGKGHRFFSHSDTEVILKAWHEWGPDSLRKLNGMFAFAIDRKSVV